MLDLRAPTLPHELGEYLARADYKRDFRERRVALRNSASWKLERLQHFEEIGDASRDALRRGDWQGALRLFDARRDALVASAADDARRGSAFNRLRIVEEPLTPYVQWELHWLRLSAECGHHVRVLPASAVAASETEGMLPELTILGGRVLYRVVYTESGTPDGAMRFTDPETVGRWAAFISDAYATADDVRRYFTRVVEPLPPPQAA
ncbi:DUF6879 family protein [Actinacidiphila acididurans]|uniref:DUF6879 domain-containing protein n=1 Tax=Actinacidiphila acididurans TaxID=2784346 RepID=A0ABS2U158_9ACTN|nr:DUF6879 family protein [Actinacidiphila acididurans]MBM9508265.1 hypothetical protein [Actinacidiphila acididurans]